MQQAMSLNEWEKIDHSILIPVGWGVCPISNVECELFEQLEVGEIAPSENDVMPNGKTI